MSKQKEGKSKEEETEFLFSKVPPPLWESIFTFLLIGKTKKEKKIIFSSIRLSCKLFRNIISKFWKQVVPLNFLKNYFENCSKYSFSIQSIYLVPSKYQEELVQPCPLFFSS